MTPHEVLNKAAVRVGEGDRDYGHALRNFRNIAELWGVLLGVPVTRAQVAQCLAALKLARLIHDPGHADSWVDLAGYAALGPQMGGHANATDQ